MTMFIFRPWKIGRIMGVPISIDPSWLVIFGLLTFQLATGIFPAELGPRRAHGLTLETLILGVIASLFLFISVLAHELSHAWMATHRGIPVLGITLFIFGGVAQIADEPDRPATEFWIAIMGPLMSFALALVFAAFWIWSQAMLGIFFRASSLLVPIAVVSLYLAEANGLLVAFNLLPGFPLDGGRVFRALVWGLLHNLSRATYVAMLLGRGIALVMIVGGLYLTYSTGLGGLWLILIGAFLWQASGEAYRSVLLRDSLKQVSVGRVMHAPVEYVSGNLPLASFVDEFLLRRRAAVFAVEEDSQAIGVIGAAQVRKIPRTGWNGLRVRDAMVPLSPTNVVTPQDPALHVMQQLARQDDTGNNDGDELPVLMDGQVVGIVGQEEISRYLQWKAGARER